MKGYRLHPAVPGEVEAAALWYEERSAGLGEEFVSAVEHATRLIAEAPRTAPLWPLVAEEFGVHRHLLLRFPFAVAYLDEPGGVVILAVAHTRREPLYWLGRR